MFKKDPLRDLHYYSSTFTISQVVKYFEKQGLVFTKTMIQNYIRVGVLPAPDGRSYTKRHLMGLTLIDSLKDIYSLDEIKNIFAALETEAALTDFYTQFFQSYAATLEQFGAEPQKDTQAKLVAESAALCDLVRNGIVTSST